MYIIINGLYTDTLFISMQITVNAVVFECIIWQLNLSHYIGFIDYVSSVTQGWDTANILIFSLIVQLT